MDQITLGYLSDYHKQPALCRSTYAQLHSAHKHTFQFNTHEL